MKKTSTDGIIRPRERIYINSAASVAGHEEEKGLLGGKFDIVGDKDDMFGTDSFERAEAKMQYLALSCAMQKAGVQKLDCIFAGDLLNQCVSSAYGLLDFKSPLIGLYGACSTCAEGLLAASAFCPDSLSVCGVVTSSHYCTSERQFRFPLEYGAQRPPTAQWTVTGSGAFIISGERGSDTQGEDVEIADALPGIPRDLGINDANDMGAAMAPAACDTVVRYFEQTGTSPEDYDLILTGDLGVRGSVLLTELCAEKGYDIGGIRADCGEAIYNIDKQDKHSGGSGCGCSAAVLAADIIPRMRQSEYKNVLFIGTGALMNPQSLMQGENIIGIGHLVHLKTSE